MHPGEGEPEDKEGHRERFTGQYLNCLFNENWPGGQGGIVLGIGQTVYGEKITQRQIQT